MNWGVVDTLSQNYQDKALLAQQIEYYFDVLPMEYHCDSATMISILKNIVSVFKVPGIA